MRDLTLSSPKYAHILHAKRAQRLFLIYQLSILAEETKKLLKYSFFAVFTTLIFWFTEYVFWVVYQTHTAREIGAIIGLSIGYYLKYNLDKKYVFNKFEAK